MDYRDLAGELNLTMMKQELTLMECEYVYR